MSYPKSPHASLPQKGRDKHGDLPKVGGILSLILRSGADLGIDRLALRLGNPLDFAGIV
jgi:hypothetical protein